MATNNAYHIFLDGNNLVIVIMPYSFGKQSKDEQDKFIDDLHCRAEKAGLAGDVATVWRDVSGQMEFMAPDAWHPFLRKLNLEWIKQHLNREL